MLERTDSTDNKRRVNRKGSQLTIALFDVENTQNVRSLRDQIASALANDKVKSVVLDGNQTHQADCSFCQLVVAAAAQAQLHEKQVVVSRLAPNLVNIATLFGIPLPTDTPETERVAS